jgi:hypothetical protein
VNYDKDKDIDETIRIVIVYLGVRKDPGLVTIDLSLMTGGAIGTSPIYSVNKLREFSNRPLFGHVPYDFLYTGCEQPSL